MRSNLLPIAFASWVAILAVAPAWAASPAGKSLDYYGWQSYRLCKGSSCKVVNLNKHKIMIYIGKNGAFYDYTGSNSGDIYYSGRWKKGSKMSVRGDRFVIEGKGNDFNYTWSYKISGNKCRASFRISSKEKAWKVDSEREHTMKCTVHDGNKFAR